MARFEISLGRCSFCERPGTRTSPLAGRAGKSARICRTCTWRKLGEAPEPKGAKSAVREAYSAGGSRDARTRDDRSGGLSAALAREIEQVEQALAKNSKDDRTRVHLADLLVQARRPEEALEHYEKVAAARAKRDPLKAVGLYRVMLGLGVGPRKKMARRLGDLYAELGLDDDAQHAYGMVEETATHAKRAPRRRDEVPRCAFCGKTAIDGVCRACLDSAAALFAATA